MTFEFSALITVVLTFAFVLRVKGVLACKCGQPVSTSSSARLRAGMLSSNCNLRATILFRSSDVGSLHSEVHFHFLAWLEASLPFANFLCNNTLFLVVDRNGILAFDWSVTLIVEVRLRGGRVVLLTESPPQKAEHQCCGGRGSGLAASLGCFRLLDKLVSQRGNVWSISCRLILFSRFGQIFLPLLYKNPLRRFWLSFSKSLPLLLITFGILKKRDVFILSRTLGAAKNLYRAP